jgi:ABC-2 type transport system ATP-binding protein
MLRFENLCKHYGERTIFQGLHCSVDAGCVALNDESGSGKSILLSILAGEIEADAGEVWLGGHSLRSAPVAARAALAYVPDDCLPGSMEIGRDFLERIATERQTALDSRVLELADRFGLTAHLEKRFEQMSFGTRKKIFLTAASIGQPAVVIADEPGGGLDAPARGVLVELFNLLGQDRVVFFTSYDAALTSACEAKVVSFADLAAKA